jgi:hypothetical protein
MKLIPLFLVVILAADTLENTEARNKLLWEDLRNRAKDWRVSMLTQAENGMDR